MATSPHFPFWWFKYSQKNSDRGNLWMATPSPKTFYTYCLCNGSTCATSNDRSSEYQLSVSINVRDGKPTRPQCMCVLVLGSTDNTGYKQNTKPDVVWWSGRDAPFSLRPGPHLGGKIRKWNLVEGRVALCGFLISKHHARRSLALSLSLSAA